MLRGYARARSLRRWLVPVPVLTPRLSSYWVHLVTPVPAAIAQPLVQGLRNDVVVRDPRARQMFPHIQPMDYHTAVQRALANLDRGEVETAWSDAVASSQGDVTPVQLTLQEGMILERRQRLAAAPPPKVFRAFTHLGGQTGWLYLDWAWRIRGALDRLLGGVGLRRGRRHPQELHLGDAVDFWRVEAVEPDRALRLRAEMKVPGRAWIEFRVEPRDANRSVLSQTAFFAPRGLLGLLYWYALYPIHALIFSGLIRAVAERAESGCSAALQRTSPSQGPSNDGRQGARPAQVRSQRFLNPNIGRAGRIARGVLGLVLLTAGLALGLGCGSLGLTLVLIGSGVVALLEAARGWCLLRACGIKTKF